MDSDAEVLERSDRFVRKVVAFTEEDSSRELLLPDNFESVGSGALVAQQDAARTVRCVC